MIYIVCSDTEIIDKFDNVDDARTKANNMAIANPGINFWIYAPNIHYLATAPQISWNYCSNTGAPVQ